MNKLENQKEKNRKLAKRRKGEDGSDNDPMHDGESDSDADEVQGASNASEKGGPDANSEEDETEDDRDEDEIWRVRYVFLITFLTILTSTAPDHI